MGRHGIDESSDMSDVWSGRRHASQPPRVAAAEGVGASGDLSVEVRRMWVRIFVSAA